MVIKMILKDVFDKKRIVGVIGNTNSGKSNNIIYLIDDFRKTNKDVNIAIYGFKEEVSQKLQKKYNCQVIETLEHISQLKNSLIVMDEFQKLRLGDRRYKVLTDEFFDFIYHNNNWIILSSPNLSEYNKLICSKVEIWLLKSLFTKQLVNGSDIKRIVEDYKGDRKRLGYLHIDKSELMLHSSTHTALIKCDYMKDFDSKSKNIDIFA